MKQYLGTKEIKARLMNRLEYNQYRGWELLSDESGADGGMLVEYVDGGKANDTRHKGYISWSPIKVFENAYKVAETWKDRVYIELNTLSDKCIALDNALIRGDVPEEARPILHKQLRHMRSYADILVDRVEGEHVTQFSFSEAITMLKEGKCVARKGWNGKDMYLYLMQGYPVNGHLNAGNPVEALEKTLPDGSPNVTKHSGGQMQPCIIMKVADSSESWGKGYSDYVTWNPSISDILAEDWYIVN